MNLLLLGINHKTAEIGLREKVAFTDEQLSEALISIQNTTGLLETSILSTCNRTEIYGIAKSDQTLISAQNSIMDWVCQYQSLSTSALKKHSYFFTNEAALVHMIKVASGLDSMALGEPQILGQMKNAYLIARQAKTINNSLNEIFQYIFSCSKQVRTNTEIGQHPTSLAYAAVKLSQHIFSDLTKTNVLLIGAGQMIELAAKHLYEKNVNQIIIANRTLSHAQQLAKKNSGEAVLLADIPEQLANSDIVIASTASQLPILGKGAVETALKQRKHKPIFMVDLAVPRDIESEVNDLEDVYLYTVDDLQSVISENLKNREQAAIKANKIIENAAATFKLPNQDISELIRQYRTKIEILCQQELEQALLQLQTSDSAETIIKQFARSYTNKLLHDPTINIKNLINTDSKEIEEIIKSFKLLVNLNNPDDN